MSDLPQQITEADIFNIARSISDPNQRRNYLDQICCNDLVTRQSVEELLEIYDQEKSFLESPYREQIPTLLELDVRSDCKTIESKIGPFKILELIGEGGMGSVYMAEQVAPVRRKVALKVIRSGMDNKNVIARFDAERQALALMDHPHIAKYYDAGISDLGSPYFVMELVKGLPINQFVQTHQLDLNARLELFQQACTGVQHAHQKGIIHRDLKPNNILVAKYDEKPVVKIIDFGVAKALGEPLTDKTMFTRFGQLVGTLEYMSPEQSQLNQLDVDTRSDVYSLGAILYELLTGVPPFDKSTLGSAAFDEALRIIREEDPVIPSTRLSHISSINNVENQIKHSKLSDQKRIPEELDWIVMKSLEKDRIRRYSTPVEIIQEIQRFINNEAVSAGPPTLYYRWSKFAKRNRIAILLAAVVVTTLIIATTFSVWRSITAARAEAKAKLFLEDSIAMGKQLDRANNLLAKRFGEVTKAKQQSDKQRDRAERSYEFINRMILTPIDRGSDAKLRDLIVEISRNLDGEFQNDPQIRASLLYSICCSNALLDEPALQDCPGRCIRACQEAFGFDSEDTIWVTLNLMDRVSENDRAEFPETRQWIEDLTDRSVKALGPNHMLTFFCQDKLAMLYADEGTALYDESIQLMEDIMRRYDPEQIEMGSAAAFPIHNTNARLAHVYSIVGRDQDAIQLLEKKTKELTATNQEKFSISLFECLASIHNKNGNYDKAQEVLVELCRNLKDSGSPRWARAEEVLAFLHVDNGKFRRALVTCPVKRNQFSI